MLSTQNRMDSQTVRPAAVAGVFYPADPIALRHQIGKLLGEASGEGPIPKALVVPHAGYVYSGAIAASGYALLEPIRHRIERVVLLGPSHRVPFSGLAATASEAFVTPLGPVAIDLGAVDAALHWPQVELNEDAHRYEHSLEVQLPFLQSTLDDFVLVPFAVGQASAGEVGAVIDSLWDGIETLVVVSSDLSHYHEYEVARIMDAETSRMIEQCRWRELTGERACGFGGVRGLLQVAESRGQRVKTVDLRNSGDSCGRKDQVVGYGCYAVY